ncbi:hypothetical protein KJ359_005295 [Pestalotiopsis sp. 9143b]|nr:hypothetical protein KJ359_005295 [Pestalotiopsis sp. 9143b]
MPRDHFGWNKSIRKGVDTLLSGPKTVDSAAARTSAALQTSNLMESTHSTSNVLATSQAFLRARERLQNAITASEVDGDVDEFPDPELLDHISRIEQYTNHRVSLNLVPFHMSRTAWKKVCLAAEATKELQKMARGSESVSLIPGSLFGTTKPYAVFDQTHDGVRYLILAVQATRTCMDWSANINAQLVESNELGEQCKCHKAFLSIARSMKASIIDSIHERVAISEQKLNVIFTGHSSGSAVAQILFSTVFPGAAIPAYPQIGEADCITFGGPPVTFPPLETHSSGMFLNFINEGDPVALAEPDYIESLLQAYASRSSQKDAQWKVPRPTRFSIGALILLKDVSSDDSDDDNPAAFRIDHGDLEGLIFGNPLRHSMSLYRQRVESLRERANNEELV